VTKEREEKSRRVEERLKKELIEGEKLNEANAKKELTDAQKAEIMQEKIKANIKARQEENAAILEAAKRAAEQ